MPAPKPPTATWRVLLPAFFVACFWLNQGISRAHLEVMRDEIFPAPSEHVARVAWYPLAFAYHRAIDEQMYFETAGVIFGLDADRAWLAKSRGTVSDAFNVPLPPADGRFHAPYTEVPLEYPPIGLPALLLPRLLASSFEGYARIFGLEMGLCLVAAFALALATLRRGGATDREIAQRGWLAAGLLLAEGSLAIQRLDAMTALFLALMLHAAIVRRHALFGLASGLAVAAKLIPAIVLPSVVLADPGAWKGTAARVRTAVAFAVAMVVGFVPLAFAPGAFRAIVGYHATRGLQVESTLGILWGSLRALAGMAAPATYSFGSLNFDDPVADALAKGATLLTLGVAGWLAWRAFRSAPTGGDGPARARHVALVLFAAVVTLWLSGKVFSPQYMTWALPLALAIPGKDGLKVVWGMIATLTLTQIYMRGYYPAIIAQEAIGLVTLLVRQAMLVGLAVFAIRALTRVPQAEKPAISPPTEMSV
ncbi:MAG: sle [Myxococcaceae bacterium]|nr:sle [Myxococcaceae bacterium]